MEKDLLHDKVVLVVDDGPDVVQIVGEILDTCIVHKAYDYETAQQYLASYVYDFVILDIMGVNGFELLRSAVSRGFPTIMLTAHALTPEAIKKSIKLGAVTFLPKDKIGHLKEFIEDVILREGRPAWVRFFDSLGEYFAERFGPDWKEKDRFFKEFEETLRASS